MNKFIRTEMLLGKRALKKLCRSTVAVIGLGAVGSFALEALARCGIGRFVIADFDVIKDSNFNRQLFATESNRGILKAEAAVSRIKDINPDCDVCVYTDFVDSENHNLLISENCGVVIDAIDSVNPKTRLIAFCVNNNLPIVSSMGAGQKTDPFSIKTGDLSQTRICPLAKLMRKRLKKYGIDKGVRCVYSDEEVIKNKVKPSEEEEEFYKRGRKRPPIGTISYYTGIFGLLAAYEAVEILLNR